MNQNHTKILSTLVLGLTLSGIALAGPEPRVSINVPIAAPVTNALPIGAVGTTAYNGQEGAHGAITSTTGQSVAHYYVHVVVNGQDVPVDPFMVNR